jgi:hypothetical protein
MLRFLSWQNRFCLEVGVGWDGGRRRGEVAQTMHAYISKCKNNEIKERKIKYSQKEKLMKWRIKNNTKNQ